MNLGRAARNAGGWLLTVIAVAAAVSALVPVLVGAAYLTVRRRNRATEAATDDALGLRRVVLGDRLELTATALSEVGDRWDALSFIWFVRPSQHLRNLPGWAQDSVVLLDLRRELQLRGVESALSDEPGLYRHGFARVCEAATHTGSAELLDDARVWAGLLESAG